MISQSGAMPYTFFSVLFLEDEMEQKAINPIMRLDYPDPDVIRVGDIYYMVTTTMHFMPGCEILRSYDLVHWEHVSFVFDKLDHTPGQCLTEGRNIYGKGMWAASLRFHKGMYYVCFVANDTGKTYLYTSKNIEGPWKKSYIDGFYHDASLLFDDDKVYLAYGNTDVYITQLKPDLSGPLEGGLHRLAVSDSGHPGLGYEGSHFYKINGKYYLFLIHSLRDRWMRTEACFVADSPDGEFAGGDVLVDDRGYCGQGVAQGGIVDTPEGKWYAILFQDHGAVGRIPVLIPAEWKDGYPVFGENGEVPIEIAVLDGKPGYHYEPLTQSDDFKLEKNLTSAAQKQKYGCFGLKSVWQFNHEPELSLVTADREAGILWMKTGKLCRTLTQAQNILTQRMYFPRCAAEVTVDAGALEEGDYAGICALQGCYGMVAVTRRNGRLCVMMKSRVAEDLSLQESPEPINNKDSEWELAEIDQSRIRLRIEADFTEMKDEAKFFYLCDGVWKQIGITQKLVFQLDHFTGCRFGLFVYATEIIGGKAGFMDFEYHKDLKIKE